MKIIYERGDYKIKLEKIPNKKAVELLHSTLWGTAGPLFQHMDTPEKVHHLHKSLAFTLEKNDKAIGTCTVLEREITLDGKIYKTWYGRYFTVEKKYQGRIFGNLLLKHMKSYMEEISSVPTIFYAYVDQANPRSRKLLQYTGFEIIRNFETSIFSRLYPKKDKRFSRLRENEFDLIKKILQSEYSNETFVNFDNLFYQNNYFVLKNGNEIIAGLQATKVKWKIRFLPGLSGKIMIKVLPFTPFLSRLFNPNEFYFAAFEGIYCKQGYEKDLFLLMESACAELNLCNGMIWWDQKSELKQRIKPIGDWGLMNKISKSVPIDVIAGFRNINQIEKKKFYDQPAYISAFDLT